MRKIVLVIACGVLTACATVPEAVPPEVEQQVKIYDVNPPYSQPLGNVSATACDEPRESATRRLLAAARSQGANGVTQLKCTDTGMTMACWSSMQCEALALNVSPPPPPPKKPPPKKRPAKKPQPKR